MLIQQTRAKDIFSHKSALAGHYIRARLDMQIEARAYLFSTCFHIRVLEQDQQGALYTVHTACGNFYQLLLMLTCYIYQTNIWLYELDYIKELNRAIVNDKCLFMKCQRLCTHTSSILSVIWIYKMCVRVFFFSYGLLTSCNTSFASR